MSPGTPNVTSGSFVPFHTVLPSLPSTPSLPGNPAAPVTPSIPAAPCAPSNNFLLPLGHFEVPGYVTTFVDELTHTR